MNRFKWEPGKGFDERALTRLQAYFARPHTPMGEAWFMGDTRRYFDHLLEDLHELPTSDLTEPLAVISSGTSSFGPFKEWERWFGYLFAQLVPRAHEYDTDYLLEYLVTGFISQYPDGINTEPYKGFKEDAINTIGQCMMDSSCWTNGKINVGKILIRPGRCSNQFWGWWEVSGEFSASLFFCLKYLPVTSIPVWFESIMKIQCPYWRAQTMAWLVGANDIICDTIQQPSQFKSKSGPQIGWAESHVLSGIYENRQKPENFIPKQNRDMLLKVVNNFMTEELFLQWLISISNVDSLESEIAGIPDDFIDIYLNTEGSDGTAG